MSAKHRDPLYLKNSRLVRDRVKRSWAHGLEVRCRRCHREIEPGMRFDVGHIDPAGGHGFENLAPEHQRCNRSAGGRVGAAITNRSQPRPERGSTRLAPW